MIEKFFILQMRDKSFLGEEIRMNFKCAGLCSVSVSHFFMVDVCWIFIDLTQFSSTRADHLFILKIVLVEKHSWCQQLWFSQ